MLGNMSSLENGVEALFSCKIKAKAEGLGGEARFYRVTGGEKVEAMAPGEAAWIYPSSVCGWIWARTLVCIVYSLCTRACFAFPYISP